MSAISPIPVFHVHLNQGIRIADLSSQFGLVVFVYLCICNFSYPLLLSLLLPLVPHQVEEEESVFVRVCQVADRRLRDRAVHLHLQETLVYNPSKGI